MDDIKRLNTEQNNENSWNIDLCTTKEILTIINEEDKLVALAVEKCKNEIAAIVNYAVDGIQQGGRVIYVGAGTSGRLGILDASECPPTYGVSYETVQGIIAGGREAMIKAKEGSEDSFDLGMKDMKQLALNDADVVIGLAASGRTPYVLGALTSAKKAGCHTGSISCVKHAKLSEIADVSIEVITGAEVICGSTRMKAGTAQKMILNMISTATMIQLGKVFHNIMVDFQPTNEKLIQRAKHMIKQCIGCSIEEADDWYNESDGNVKIAIAMAKSRKSKLECNTAMIKSKGNLRKALKLLS